MWYSQILSMWDFPVYIFNQHQQVRIIQSSMLYQNMSYIHNCYLWVIESYFLTFDLNLTQVVVYRMITAPQLSLVSQRIWTTSFSHFILRYKQQLRRQRIGFLPTEKSN
jgi:hypothetical protein